MIRLKVGKCLSHLGRKKKVIIEERHNKCQKSMPREIVKKKDIKL